jgi:four helix bundle protein
LIQKLLNSQICGLDDYKILEGGIMKYKRFEELPCWIKGRDLCQAVFEIINQTQFRKDFSLRDQLWRAAGAAMDNIAEGFDDGSTRELIRFLGYSQRSCSEVQSQVYRALDCKYITKSQFDRIYEVATECRKQIKGFRKYLRDFRSDS